MRQQGAAVALAGVLLATALPALGRDVEGEKEVQALLRRGEALKQAGKDREAILVYEKLLKKVKQVYGADSITAVAQMNNLAELYRAMGEHGKAEPLLLRSLEISEGKLGKDHPSFPASLHNLALLYRDIGQHGKAEPLFLRALEINEDKLGKDHPHVAISLTGLAQLYQAMGDHVKAEPLYRRSLKIFEAKFGKDHPHVAISLSNLADLYRAMGRHEKAEPLFRRTLKISEDKLGKDHAEVAVALNNLAALYQDMGQHGKAEPLFRRSLQISEDKLGKDHPHVATYLHNLAALYGDMRQHGKAEPLLLRSLEIREDKLGKDHPAVANSLHNLAGLYRDMRQDGRAEPLFWRSLKIWEEKLGKGHPDVAASLNNLGELYRDLGQHARAEPPFRRSLKILEGSLGKDHPTVGASLNNLATLYAAGGQAGEAAGLTDRARRVARRHLAAVLPLLADSEKAAFFRNTNARGDMEAALSLGLAGRADAALNALSASWLVNGKAPELESLASGVLLARRSGDPAVGKLSGQLLTLRRQLARLTLAEPRPGQEKQRLGQIEELTTQEQDLAKRLRQAGSTAAPPPWVEQAELRQALPADSALIDIAHFKVYDFEAKPGKRWQAARYAAWVTPAKGDVRVIDLGPADKIDAAVKAFREAIESAAKLVKGEGEESAEKAIRGRLDALSKLVLAPLLPHVGKAERWFVSPDGNLWLVPFEALTLSDGWYAVEKYRISYLTSGRDLVALPDPKVKVTAPLVLADPDFDLTAEAAHAGAKKLGVLTDEETRSAAGGLRLGYIRRLAGTAAEARAITPALRHYAAPPRVHLREQALEAVFKAVKSPRVVVLSTHGFFLPDRAKPREDDEVKAKPVWENPLLRCGLLLAGCNNAAKAKEGEDGGVLTGLEVIGTDLHGCELVVLSACETGVGAVQSGEGVSGLRQAFQLAGAKAVVSTLWQVPDKSSARLMTLFFDNLARGKLTKADALRAAKVRMIEERREDYASAHPFFWAAFTLTGE